MALALSHHARAAPGFLEPAPPSSNQIPGVVPRPMPAQDVFAFNPVDGSVPRGDWAECGYPAGAYPLESINPGQRITVAGVPTLIATLVIPNESTYQELDVAWWVDYPLMADLGLVSAFLSVNGGAPVALPAPTHKPMRLPMCLEAGMSIRLFAFIPGPFDLGGGPFSNIIYVGGSLQTGYLYPQDFQKTDDVARPVQSVQSVNVLVAPGAPFFNVVVVPTMCASYARIAWPRFVAGPPPIGTVQYTTLSELGAPQASQAIDQVVSNFSAMRNIPMGDLSELMIGDPAVSLALPATVVIEWDTWRRR